MKSYQIEILNPKALKLLKDLADLKLITFRESEETLEVILKSLRAKAAQNPPTFEDITSEVEFVRSGRHDAEKK